MVATATKPALMTAEEFYEWAMLPENADKRYELENGVPVEMPNPSELHGTVCWLVIHLLTTYVLPRGGRLLTNDAGVIVRRRPDTVRGPDVTLFMNRPRMEDIPRGPAELVPTLVVEVLSPSDRPSRTAPRVRGYLRRGIPMVWLVDPDDRTVTVHTADDDVILGEADEIVGGDVLPDFRCPVASFFNWPDEQPPAPANP